MLPGTASVNQHDAREALGSLFRGPRGLRLVRLQPGPCPKPETGPSLAWAAPWGGAARHGHCTLSSPDGGPPSSSQLGSRFDSSCRAPWHAHLSETPAAGCRPRADLRPPAATFAAAAAATPQKIYSGIRKVDQPCRNIEGCEDFFARSTSKNE